MTRTLTITAAEWASAHDGTLWLVRDACYDLRCSTCGGSASLPLEMTCVDHRPQMTPPVEFTLACAPCETCDGDCRLVNLGRFGPPYAPCPDCRIELVRPCLSGCDGWGVIFCGDDDDIGDACDGECEGNGTVTLGHAYAVGQPLPIDWAKSNRSDPFVGVWSPPYPPTVLFAANDADGVPINLAHYGDPATLVGKWALQLAAQP